MNKRLAKRLFTSKGLTLVELILAILLTASLAVCVSGLMGFAFTTQHHTENLTSLGNASMRIHRAFRDTLMGAQNVTLTATPTLPREGVQVIAWHQEDGTILLDGGDFLYNAESYDGCKVAGFKVEAVRIPDQVNYEDQTIGMYYRALHLTTLLTKDGSEFTQESTIRLYNFSTSGAVVIGDEGVVLIVER